MPEPKVSIVLPTYNRAWALERSIGSVLNQTFKEFELIVIDDGSTDQTSALVARYQDARLRYHRFGSNKGVGAAREAGIELATAPYLAFQDSDDYWLPEKLELKLRALETAASEYGAAYCGRIIYGCDEHFRFGPRRASYVPAERLKIVDGDIYATLLEENRMATTQLLVRRDLVLQAGGFDPDLRANDDWDLVLRLAQLTKFVFVEKPLIIAFTSGDSISKSLYWDTISFARIAEKHQAALARRPRLRARLLHHVGRGAARLGACALARRYLRRAIEADPTYWKPWAAWIYSYGPAAIVSPQRQLDLGIEAELTASTGP